MDRCHVVLATLFVAKQYHSLPPSIIDVRIRRFAVLVFRPVCSALSYVRYLPFSRGEEMSDTGAFLVSAVGQIEKAHFPDFDNVYCKYAFVSGPDWEIVTVSVLWRYEFACIRGISVRHSSPCLVVWGGWRGESKYAFAFGRPFETPRRIFVVGSEVGEFSRANILKDSIVTLRVTFRKSLVHDVRHF